MEIIFIIALAVGALFWFSSRESDSPFPKIEAVPKPEPISEKSRLLLEKYDSYFNALFPDPLTE